MTKKEYKDLLNEWKDETNYFNGSISTREMFDTLRNRMDFGHAETCTIIAALVLAGAKFKEEEND